MSDAAGERVRVSRKRPHPGRPLRSVAHRGNREMFVHNLIAGMSHREAYIAAGYADCHATAANAVRLARDPVVIARMDWLLVEQRERAGADLALRRNRLVAVLERLLGDRADMFDDDWRLKPKSQMTAEQLAMIDSIRPTKSGAEAIMPPRLAALQLLARIEGLEAPSKSEQNVHVTREDARLTDVQLARWVAHALESGAEAADGLPALAAPDRHKP